MCFAQSFKPEGKSEEFFFEENNFRIKVVAKYKRGVSPPFLVAKTEMFLKISNFSHLRAKILFAKIFASMST